MRLGVDQLGPALKKGLVPIYFISGDEPLQLGEAADAVRTAARQAGFDNREVFHAEGNFQWNEFLQAADSLPLFSERRLLDVRVPSGKPGTEGAAALTEYARRIPDDTILLVTAGKLASSASRAAWFQALDKQGVVIQVWPLAGRDLLEWLERRMLSRGLKTDRAGLQILASRVEGNLLAAAQEIDKLFVLNGAGRIEADAILEAVANSSRFDVFNLVDGVLLGQGERAVRILGGLKAEGTAPAVVLWALAREARLLSNLCWDKNAGLSPDAAARKHKVWDKRKPMILRALQRLPQNDLFDLLSLCAQADRTIKGMEPGDPWDMLLTVSMRFAGVKF